MDFCLHALILFSFALGTIASIDQDRSIKSDCWSRLRSHPGEYEVCKTQLCLLLIDEGPYAIVPKTMAAENNQALFKCKEREAIFPGLRGVSFSIMDKME